MNYKEILVSCIHTISTALTKDSNILIKGKIQVLPYYGDAQTLPITIDVLNSVFVLEILKKCVNFWIGRVKMARL